MRGKDTAQKRRTQAGRITPAHAGKSHVHHQREHRPQDHPRACGEKSFAAAYLDMAAGSPPRMRGKAFKVCHLTAGQRITPAHAGKSDRCPICSSNCRDHPRACGEKQPLFQLSYDGIGSPPRMRGKERISLCPTHNPRITPAQAGKRRFARANSPITKDHPRACGEKYSAHAQGRNQRGSPPRMRGKVEVPETSRHPIRITPAHAGKSKIIITRLICSRDHPRACGEKTMGGTE